MQKTRVEELAEFVYDLLLPYERHNLSEHEDRQDIAWSIAQKVYNKYKK